MPRRKTTRRRFSRRQIPAKGGCYFCAQNTRPNFSDTEILSRFLTRRAKIRGRIRTGVCAKHQQELTKQIKLARILALLKFRDF